MIDQNAENPPKGVPVVDRPASRHRSSSALRVALILFGGTVILLLAISIVSLFSSKNSFSEKPFKIGKQIGVLEISDIILDSKTPIERLRAFVADDHIKAIIIRINSPGGAIAPSQEIFREIMRAREKKKIVASMGTLAASGGYYIAAAADTIMASEGTITGSIGVIMKFINFEELQQWAKIKSDMITSGPFKAMGAPTRPMTAAERDIFESMIHEMLEQFIDDITKGRAGKITREEVAHLADGRIYTGKNAKRLKLVDELGNLQDAIDLAAKMVGIEGEPKVVYPPEPKMKLREALFGQVQQGVVEQLLHLVDGRTPYFLYTMQ